MRVMVLTIALLISWPSWVSAQRARPDSTELETMRRELQEKQRERERLAARQELIPWKPINDKPMNEAGGEFGYVRIANGMTSVRAIWTFLPARKAQAEDGEGLVAKPVPGAVPIVVPICIKGDQWLRLPAGTWLIQLEAGLPGADRNLTMAPRPVDLPAGHAFALDLDNDVESRIKEVLRQINKPRPDPSAPAEDVGHTPRRRNSAANPPKTDSSETSPFLSQ